METPKTVAGELTERIMAGVRPHLSDVIPGELTGHYNRSYEHVLRVLSDTGGVNLHTLILISCERFEQDKQWGGAAHDDTHDIDDWTVFIGKQLTKAVDAETVEERSRALVKAAALAIAALESHFRLADRERN